ncbi:crossover junction endodeoxyribonuclease RuvC/Holliday junction DNA helicase RuvA subunit [Bradyrhizobium sp. LB13.1]
MTALPIRVPVRIIGIDPGLRRTGWGVIEAEGNRLIYVACGSVEPPDDLPLASRLLAIHEGLAAILSVHKPMEAAVEQTFINKDGAATLKLGQARGVAMLAPAIFGISVAEYAPNQVKKTVVGAGHADKHQIAMMLKILLPKSDPPSADAADALAIAITHAHSSHEHGAQAEGGGVMIGKLKGLIDSYGEDFVILDVGGVGYQVHCSSRTLQHLPSPGEAAVLSIETYVREDQIKLFGFRSDHEREWFRLLQTVQGVGAKVALAVLGTLQPSDLANAIALRDKAAVVRTPGVGPKVAERIVTELKDKAPAFATIDPAVVHLAGAVDDQRAPRPVADAISALVNLGYGQPQAAAAIASASRSAGESAETAQLIRLGLKELSK